MDKKGRESIIVANIIIFTVILIGVVMVFKVANPTGGSVSDLKSPIEITDFNAIYNPDGTVSIKFVAKANENINTGLTGSFKIRGESYTGFFEYQSYVFFDGAFGEIQEIKGVDDLDEFELEDISGNFVVTNAIDGTATILSKIDFKSPFFRGGPLVPEDHFIYVEYVTYDKIYYGYVEVPFSLEKTDSNFYTVYDGHVEIDA